MKITSSGEGALSFDISAIGGNAHTCSLNGKIVGGRAMLEGTETDKPCIVSFQAVEKGVSVSDNEGGCSYYCGARAGFTGLYLKPPPICESRSIANARKEFKKYYGAKSYGKARAKLEPVLRYCADLISWPELGWIRNDLAITQYKLRDYAGCLKTLKPLAEDAGQSDQSLRDNYPPSDADTIIPIARATRTNLDLCRKQTEKP